MTDEEIEHVAMESGIQAGVSAWEIGSKPFRQRFARSIIAQARAELIAEMQPVAWADKYALNLLRCGYHAAVSPQHTNHATCALAIIPKV